MVSGNKPTNLRVGFVSHQLRNLACSLLLLAQRRDVDAAAMAWRASRKRAMKRIGSIVEDVDVLDTHKVCSP